MSIIRIIALLTFFLVSACETVRYEYTPPSTADGKQCFTICGGSVQRIVEK